MVSTIGRQELTYENATMFVILYWISKGVCYSTKPIGNNEVMDVEKHKKVILLNGLAATLATNISATMPFVLTAFTTMKGEIGSSITLTEVGYGIIKAEHVVLASINNFGFSGFKPNSYTYCRKRFY
jgi:hypothetical protein